MQSKRYVEVRLRKDKLVLVAGHYLGLIPLNARYALHVVPKVPIENLIAVMTIAREEPEMLEGLERSYRADRRLNLFDLLVEALRQQLPLLEVHGLPRGYIERGETATSVRGRPLFKETMTRHWATGRYDRIAYTYHDFSRDIPLNRAIQYTLWHLLRTYPLVSGVRSTAVLVDLHRATAAFRRVTLDRGRHFLPGLRSLLREERLPPSQAHLRRMLHLCLMILEDLSVDLDAPKGEVVGLPPLVVNMEHVFQRFVLRVLQEQLRRRALDVWDTTTEHKRPLFSMIELPREITLELAESEKAEPDFVIAERTRPLIVGDVKYTTDRSREHVYQVVAHALAYGATNALLVYPDTETHGVSRDISGIGAVGAVRVFVYRFPLASTDLPAAMIAMAAQLDPIIRSLRQAIGSAA